MLSTDTVQALQAIALAGIAAWVAVRTHQLAGAAKIAKERADAEKARCDGLERDVRAMQKRRARRQPKKKRR